MDYTTVDGKRQLTPEALQKIRRSYFAPILPLEVQDPKMLQKFQNVVDQLEDISTTQMIIYSKNISRTITACFINRLLRIMPHPNYRIVDVNQLRSAYFDKGSHDVNTRFPGVDLLVIRVGFGEFGGADSTFLADLIAGCCHNRDLNHQYTVIYYHGTLEKLNSQTKFITGDGYRLTNLFKYTDLNR